MYNMKKSNLKNIRFYFSKKHLYVLSPKNKYNEVSELLKNSPLVLIIEGKICHNTNRLSPIFEKKLIIFTCNYSDIDTTILKNTFYEVDWGDCSFEDIIKILTSGNEIINFFETEGIEFCVFDYGMGTEENQLKKYNIFNTSVNHEKSYIEICFPKKESILAIWMMKLKVRCLSNFKISLSHVLFELHFNNTLLNFDELDLLETISLLNFNNLKLVLKAKKDDSLSRK